MQGLGIVAIKYLTLISHIDSHSEDSHPYSPIFTHIHSHQYFYIRHPKPSGRTHFDVSMCDVYVVEEFDGRPNVTHDL